MSQELYYTPPSQKTFEDLKKHAIELWGTYDNKYGYVDKKVGAIKDIENVSDNFMFIFAMFDVFNQEILLEKVSKKTREELHKRLPYDYYFSAHFMKDLLNT